MVIKGWKESPIIPCSTTQENLMLVLCNSSFYLEEGGGRLSRRETLSEFITHQSQSLMIKH